MVENYIYKFLADTESIKKAIRDLEQFQKILDKSVDTNIKATKVYADIARIQDVTSTKYVKTKNGIQEVISTGKKLVVPFRAFEDGKEVVKEFTAQIAETGGQLTKTSVGVGEASRSTVNAINEIEQGTKRLARAGQTLGEQFVKAFKRVLIVVPVWYAFRRVFTGILRLIGDGLRYWEEFDRMLQKSKQVIHDYSGSSQEAIKELRDAIQDLALQTGESMDKLASAFYRFGTLGISFQESIAGMEASLRTATVMFGDTDQIARTLAQTYRLLGDSLGDQIPVQERAAVMGGLIYKLWKDNAFEIMELKGAMDRFLPTAKMLNVSFDEMVALLATVHSGAIKAQRGGRLLRSSFLKLLDNINEVATQLGITIHPLAERPFEILMKVLKRVNELQQLGQTPLVAVKALREIFGGMRSVEVATLLTTMYQTLVKNIEAVKSGLKSWEDVVAELTKQYDDVINQHFKLLERARELRRQLAFAFVQGVTGARDFDEGLSKLISTMEAMIPTVRRLGNFLNYLFKGLLHPEKGLLDFAREYKERYYEILSDTARDIADAVQKAFSGGMGANEIRRLIERIRLTDLREVIPDEQKELIIKELEELVNRIEKDPNLIVKLKTQVDKKEAESVIVSLKQEAEGYKKAIEEAEKRIAELKQELEDLKNAQVWEDGQIRPLRESDGIIRQINEEIERQQEILNENRMYYNAVLKEIEQQENVQNKLSQYIAEILANHKELLDTIKREVELAELRKKGYDELEIAEIKLRKMATDRVKQWNELQKQQGNLNEMVDEQAFVSAILAGNWEKVLEMTEGQNVYIKDTLEDYIKLHGEIEKLRAEREIERDILDKETDYLETLKTLGASELEIEIERLRLMRERLGIYDEEGEKIEAIYQQERKIAQMIRDEVAGVANEFKQAFSDALADVIKGEADAKDFFKRIRDYIVDTFSSALAEGITTQIFQMTGIGNIFGRFITQLRYPELRGADAIASAFDYGSQITYNRIVEAFGQATGLFSREVTQSLSQAPQPIRMGNYLFPMGGIGAGLPLNIPLLPTFMNQWVARNLPMPMPTVTTTFPQFGNIFGLGGIFGALNKIKVPLLNQPLGNVLGMAGMGYMAGGLGGAIGGLLSMINPVLGLAGFLLGGLFQRRKTITQSTWTPEEVQEMLPYFNINIPPLPELYPLSRSRYFGTAGLNFDIDVNINVDRIEGTDKAIVEKIGKDVEERIIRIVNVRYVRDLIRGITPNKLI